MHLLINEEKEDIGKLRKSSIKEVAEILNVHPTANTPIWKRFVETRSTDSLSGDVSIMKRKLGRKRGMRLSLILFKTFQWKGEVT